MCGSFFVPRTAVLEQVMVARKYGNSVCYELDRRVVQCVLISDGCPMCFDIEGLSNGF